MSQNSTVAKSHEKRNEMNTELDNKLVQEQIIFQDPNEFSVFIESTAAKKHQTCLEVLVDYVEERDIEVESIANLISPSLRAKLEQNFVESGLMRSTPTLTDFFEN